MQLHFYPLDFDYIVRDDQVLVRLFGRLASGGKACLIHPHQPYFYLRMKGVDEGRLKEKLEQLKSTGERKEKVLAWEETEKELLGKKEKFWKVYTNFPKAVPPLARELESLGVEAYEKDILFTHRYLRDRDITPMTLVRAEGEFVEDKGLKIPAFRAESVEQESREAVQNLKILALDIETYAVRREINPEKNPILMIGLYGQDGEGEIFKKVITWKRFKHKLDYLEQVQDEIELLERFKKFFQDYQPDIVTGYFSDGFDFPYLKARADKHGIKLDFGLDYSEITAGQSSPFHASFREGESKIRGILHLDMFKFIRNIFGPNLRTESHSLDAVSRELLGHQKHQVNLGELAHVWEEEPERLADFCEYNLHDAHLALKLCQKLMPDVIEFTKLIGLPPFDLTRMRFSRLVENYILKRAMEFNVIAPNKPSDYELEKRREETIKGGFVYEPVPKLYEKIVVFDFRSLYPTIIMAHNIGPEGLRCACCPEPVPVPGEKDLWFCQKEKKFLPSVLERLILRRVDLKRMIEEDKKKGQETRILEARSYGLKILANAFYGYLAFFGARWYCLECAAATTAYARNYIQTTIGKAEKKGFKVIYADTDSCFLLLEDKVLDQAMEFMNEINFDLPGHMELEFEGYYPKGIFVALKGAEKGAKKKYALIDEKGRVSITGFETVRRNWSPVAKEVQEKVLSLVLSDKAGEAVNYAKAMVRELKQGLVPSEKLMIKTQITRELDRYETVGPHVAIARKLREQGEEIVPGTVVEYIISRGAGLVRERARLPSEVREGDYDSDYYIKNQLIPAVSGIFAVLGYREDEIFSESSQTALGKFL